MTEGLIVSNGYVNGKMNKSIQTTVTLLTNIRHQSGSAIDGINVHCYWPDWSMKTL